MSSSPSAIDPYQRFLESIPDATNETAVRELFVALAATGFQDNTFATTLALGAEHSVAFQTRGLIRRGRIDSFLDNVVVEFKARIVSLDEQEAARVQLASYIAGAWSEDKSYRRPYLAVATDGQTWISYTTSPINADVPADSGDAANVLLTQSERWPANPDERVGSSLRIFLDRIFFRKNLLYPSAANFAQDFGLFSPAFAKVTDELKRKRADLSLNPQMEIYELAWWSDLQVAYGRLDDVGTLFVRHTYLALLARLLVWATLERRPATNVDLQQVFDRSYFISKRIGNLVEDDYFSWHSMQSSVDLRPAWTALVAQLSTYRLDLIQEDILKPLYEELVDPATRHDLGEYYTPDWLANSVVDRLVDGWDTGTRGIPSVLDPACGSGSFIRAAINRVRSEQDADLERPEKLRQILSAVHAMDVHPLAVIVAKATYLIAVADLIDNAQLIVHLPVYLCNSLSGERPDRTMSLLGETVDLIVGEGDDRRAFPVSVEFVADGPTYDFAIGEILEISRSTGNSRTPAKFTDPAVRSRLTSALAETPQSDIVLNSLAAMCVHLTELIKRRRDSIFGFLLRNKYRSILLRDHFDLLVGNPPWLTVADIRPGPYRDLVLRRNAELEVAPRTAGDQAHTEIATIFIAQASTQFLSKRDDCEDVARLAFVVPRSTFTASQHRFFRNGRYIAKINPVELWDLDRVHPLFNIPSCVVFTEPNDARPSQLKRGRILSGRLPERDPSPAVARDELTIEARDFELRHLGRRSAWAPVAPVAESDEPAVRLAALVQAEGFRPRYYTRRFRQGAILYPQTLMIVEQADGGEAVTAGPVTVRTSEAAARSAKLLGSLRWQHVVDSETIFSTAAAEHILPFGIRPQLWSVVIPALTTPSAEDFMSVGPNDLRGAGLVNTADWLEMAEDHWTSVRKESETAEIWERIDHLSHLRAQAGRSRWVVLYSASAGRIVAGVLDTESLARPFVARDKTYWCSVEDYREAHFVCSFLNSDLADSMLSNFVTRGLFGKRDIHKRVLDLPWPRFNALDPDHVRLAELSLQQAATVGSVVADLPEQIGRARTRARGILDPAVTRDLEDLVTLISETAV